LARAADLHARIRDRVASLPGVQAATFSRVALLSRTRQNMTFAIAGQDAQPDVPINVLTNGIDQGFLEAMEIPVLAGRGFNGHDDGRAARVGLVNQAFAGTYFGGASPIGQTLEFNAPGFRHSVEIVGVVRDAKYTELRGVAPATVYFPALQQPDGNANFAVRARGRQAGMLQAIAAAVRGVDPDLSVLNFRTQDEQLERLHGQERLVARLSGLFGLSALALACVGLYGLLSDAVARRRAEIGLRIALGAEPRRVRRMIVGESLRLVGGGVLVGLAAAVAASRLVSTMLFEVSPTDPATYVSAAGALLTVALLASAIPASRASRVEPIRALGLR
jgi:predicted permease